MPLSQLLGKILIGERPRLRFFPPNDFEKLMPGRLGRGLALRGKRRETEETLYEGLCSRRGRVEVVGIDMKNAEKGENVLLRGVRFPSCDHASDDPIVAGDLL